MKYNGVLFICRDNFTLGPMAEAISRSLYNSIKVSSKGLVVLFEKPINPKAIVVLRNHGIDTVKETTEAVSDRDFNRGYLYLAMDKEAKDMFNKQYPALKIVTLGEYLSQPDVEDPFGGTLIEYEKCFGDISILVRKLINKLTEEAV